MSSPAIRIEGLGKRYELGANAGMFRYPSLRDVLSEGASKFATRLRQGGVASLFARAETFWALRDITFDVPYGQVVGLVGRNGAGKSTLLKVLSRITRPTAGSADLFGRVGSLLEVGTGFHPDLTGRENIFLNGAMLGMRRAEVQRNFDAIVDFSGIERFLDTPVKRYSSGMYVRLAFAVAAHLETEILFVDEVLAVGDAEFQRRCLDKMQNVVRDGRTILFVSHNMAAIKSLCQRAILFERGRIVQDGAVNDVVDHYLASGRVVSDDGAIPDAIARTGTGEGRLRRVVITTPSSPSASQVFFGESFGVAMTFEVTQPIRDAMVSVGISSLDGVRFATVYSIDGKGEPWTFAPGWHQVVVDLDLVLLPRRYTLDVAIIWSGGDEIDYVQQALDFTALDVSRGGDDSYRWQTVHGYVRPQSRWRQPEPAAAGSPQTEDVPETEK